MVILWVISSKRERERVKRIALQSCVSTIMNEGESVDLILLLLGNSSI